jgi:flagellin-like hook-associated protein FlgL
MMATDWETRELESASRERLLAEIGTLRNTIELKQIEALEGQVLRLQQELLAAKDFAMGAAAKAGESKIQAEQVLLRQVRDLQRELFASRDFAMGAAARAGESKIQAEQVLLRQKIQAEQVLLRQVRDLQRELFAAKDFAMGAASRAGEAQAQLSAQVGQLGAAQARIAFLSKHINRMRNSTTWELGHFIMLPVRVVKKITRRAS